MDKYGFKFIEDEIQSRFEFLLNSVGKSILAKVKQCRKFNVNNIDDIMQRRY